MHFLLLPLVMPFTVIVGESVEENGGAYRPKKSVVIGFKAVRKKIFEFSLKGAIAISGEKINSKPTCGLESSNRRKFYR